MRLLAILIAALTLTACGVDGPPIRPSLVTKIGVGSNGVNVGTGVTIKSGNVTTTVGAGF